MRPSLRESVTQYLGSESDSVVDQWKLLHTAVGEPGSGYIRYAAAMYFYKLGRLSGDLLEVYRICSKFDFDDPVERAKQEGIAVLCGKLSQVQG